MSTSHPLASAIAFAPVEPPDEALLVHARAALGRAYCPYSKFPVAAAVRTGDGQVFVGVNVENASYGLTVCAERVALWSAVAAGHRNLSALSLTTAQAPGTLAETMPCGACRQVMAELLLADARVVIDRVGWTDIEALLPNAFRLG